jgi:hypothetical protein
MLTTHAGAVDGLLGSITQNGKTLNFLVDNLGNIVQEVVGGGGDALQQIVGNFKVRPIVMLESDETDSDCVAQHDRSGW